MSYRRWAFDASHAYRVVAGLGMSLGIAGWKSDALTWFRWFSGIDPLFSGLLIGACGVVLLGQIRVWLSKERHTPAVDYLNAGAIIDRYISPAMVGKSPAICIIVRKDLLERFSKTTGAKLSEYEYNGVLLRQWLESNAARFLVDRRGEMQ